MASKQTNIVPVGDRVVVKPDAPDGEVVTASGIIIPDTVDKKKSEQGTIVAVGKGHMTDDGKVLPMSVKVGDKVLFSKYGEYSPEEVTVDDEEYFILSERGILAIIK